MLRPGIIGMRWSMVIYDYGHERTEYTLPPTPPPCWDVAVQWFICFLTTSSRAAPVSLLVVWGWLSALGSFSGPFRLGFVPFPLVLGDSSRLRTLAG